MSSQITGQREFLLAQFAGMGFVACKKKRTRNTFSLQLLNPAYHRPRTIFLWQFISFSNPILRKPVRPPVFFSLFLRAHIADVTVASKITIIM
jgi:hypothetical protein